MKTDKERMPAEQNGYTLIELLVVLALVAIFLVVGVPQFRQALFHDPLKLASLRLASQIQEIRALAIREHGQVDLHLELASGRYWVAEVYAGQNDSESNPQKKSLPDGVRLAGVWTRLGGEQNSGEAVIRFTPKGYVDETMLYLTDAKGLSFSLELNPFSGGIGVFPGIRQMAADATGR